MSPEGAASRGRLSPFGRLPGTILTSRPAVTAPTAAGRCSDPPVHEGLVHKVPGPHGADRRRVAVVRSGIVWVRGETEPDEGPVEAPETLKSLMAPEPFVAAPELMPATVSIPSQSGYGHRCHCQDHDC